jgi:CubicO group peptidase (beta-lactamase class C family)
LNGGIRLGEYLEQYVWGPLGMTSTTFNVHKRQDLAARKIDMSARLPTGQTVALPTPVYPSPADDDLGGVGGYSTAPDYMKLLTSLLRKDGKLLKESTIDEMFKP